MTTRDRRRARAQKREMSEEEEQRPLYDEEGMRHNERVMRQAIERDRQTAPMRFRREGKQEIPIGRQESKDRKDMPYMNREGIEHNKRVVEMNREKDKEEAMTPKKRAEIERNRSILQQIRDFLNTKV